MNSPALPHKNEGVKSALLEIMPEELHVQTDCKTCGSFFTVRIFGNGEASCLNCGTWARTLNDWNQGTQNEDPYAE